MQRRGPKSTGPRYTGPYEEPDGFRCVVFDGAGRRSSCKAPTAEAAIEAAEEALRLLSQTEEITVDVAIDRYQTYLRDVKKNKEKSWRETVRRLKLFFVAAEHGDRLLIWWTPARSAARYEEFAAGVSVDYHRNVLAEAKTFLQWCKDKPRGWLRAHPLTEVKGVGKRRHGKPQLRPEEGLRWREVALQLAEEEDGACAALLLLDTGARPGEVVSRQVRDLIDEARWVLVDRVEGEDGQGWSPKTERSKRPLGPVPADLRRLLLAQAKGKLPQSYLFPGKGAGPHDVGWIDDWVKRICRRANVPERCAHSMRGLRTTLDLLAGRQLREVADDRGHEDIKTTATSYAAAGAVEAAQQGRYLRLVGQEEQPGNSFPNFSRNDSGRSRGP